MNQKEEKLLRCWNCKNVINILETKVCNHPAQTQICPYCGKCLCENPKFRELKRIDDGDGFWHVGRYLKVEEILFTGESAQTTDPLGKALPKTELPNGWDEKWSSIINEKKNKLTKQVEAAKTIFKEQLLSDLITEKEYVEILESLESAQNSGEKYQKEDER